MNSNRQSGPRVPVRPAPPPPTSDNKQDGASSNRRIGLQITKLLPNLMRKPTSAPTGRQSSVNKKAPPPRPPPPKFPPKKQVVDLLSGSPPSSPSPTLRSQESGFEEDPELWRGWSDSSRSTPLMDWPTEAPSPLIEWPTEPVAALTARKWNSEPATPQWPSESASTQWPAPTQQQARPPAAMPTIIRPGPSKRPAQKNQDCEDNSPPMPNFPPPAPPPDLDDSLPNLPRRPSEKEPQTWIAIALYDFAATHPDDLSFKVGNEIEVLSQVDENWLLGRLGDLIGHFPACFVQAVE